MKRSCIRCRLAFGPADLRKSETRAMEGQRKASGLRGFRFVHYCCPRCNEGTIFIDVVQFEGESARRFQRRRKIMEEVAQWESHGRVPAVVVALERCPADPSEKRILRRVVDETISAPIPTPHPLRTLRSRHVAPVQLANVKTA